MAAIVANHRLAATEELQPGPTSQGRQGDLRFLPLADGGFFALWTDNLQTSFSHVVGQRYDSNGRKVGDLFDADTGTNQQHFDPSIAELAGGGFIVTWSASMGNYYQASLEGQMFDSAGQKVGGVLPLHSAMSDLWIPPGVIGLAGGGFVLVWGQDGISGYDSLRARVYDAAGAPVGAEFAVQSQVTGNAFNADVIALTGGGFVVVWDMANAGAGSSSVGARRQRARRRRPGVQLDRLQRVQRAGGAAPRL